MATKYSLAPEAARIGQELMRKHHEHLINHEARVEFIFRDDTPKKNGRETWGTARKVGGLSAFMASLGEVVDARDDDNAPFFVITLSSPIWDSLSAADRVALVDHELMHCWAEVDDEGETKLSIIGHDFEGFTEEIKRYGLWRDDAALMARAMKVAEQMELALDDDRQDHDVDVTISAGGESVTMSHQDFVGLAQATGQQRSR